MKSVEMLRKTLQISHQVFTSIVEDMQDAPLTFPTPRGGNHPLWVLGHIAFVEADVPHVLFGESNPVAHWASMFGPGTEPTDDPDDYPPFDEVLEMYKRCRARTLEILDQLDDQDLDQPTVEPPPGLEQFMATFGDTLMIVVLHQMMHRGQVADARRAIGREPLFTPGGEVQPAAG